MDFKISKFLNNKIYFVIGVFCLLFIFLIIFSLLGFLSKKIIIISIFVFLLLSPFFYHFKYLLKKGFISLDSKGLTFVVSIRKIFVTWENISEIKLFKLSDINKKESSDVKNDKSSENYCLGFNFVSLEQFPKSFVNILNLNKSFYGFHVVFDSKFFDSDIEQIYSEIIKFREKRC